MKFTLKTEGQALLNRQLDAFKHDVRARQKHARRLGGYVRSDARRNIKRQRTVDGAPFTPRKQKREQRAMLQGLAAKIKVISKAKEGGGVVVSWQNPLEAMIAYRHQHGAGEQWDPQRMAAARGTPDYKARCTRKQAKALLREGFRLPRKGKPAERLTVRQIEKSFTLGRAGVILRYMRTKKYTGKQEWLDTVPERPFLGVTTEQAEKHREKLAKAIAKAAEKARR